MNDKIPRGPFQFFRWFCPPPLLEEIEGDPTQKLSEIKLYWENEGLQQD